MNKAGISFLSMGINILSLALPLALLQVYDRIVPSQSFGSAIVIFAGTGFALIGAGFLRYVRSTAFARTAAISGHAKSLDTTRSLIGFRRERVDKRRVLNALAQSRDIDVGQGKVAYFDAPFAVVFLILVWYLGGRIVLAPLVLVAVVSVYLAIRVGTYRQRVADLAVAKANVEDAISESVAYAHQAATLDSVGPSFFDLLNLKRIEANASQKLDRFNAALMDIQQSAGLAITVAIVGVGAFSVLNGDLTTGGLAACTLLGSRGANQLLGAVMASFRHQAVKVAASEAKSTVSYTPSGNVQDIAKGYLVINPDAGTSEVDRFKTLVNDGGGQHIHHVPRNPNLMYGTILQNISSFEVENENDALRISALIGLDRLVAELPDGYQTAIGEGPSSPLSQGASKLVALTHALSSKEDVLALEDPSFSLDNAAVEGLVSVLLAQKDARAIVVLSADKRLQTLDKAETTEAQDE
ncbi:hypothetical protein [Falsiruegeria litorea]|nr:hypothetical protein [Falsiruegeria litorea]MBT3140005.1 hypothetical protein [Falsiruegeria litorea]MBT8169462.1 hypothetical protein [Falsiruegeria litorea]